MHKRFSIALACTLFALAWIMPLQAQEEENDGAANMVYITPKAGQGAALEAAIRDYHLWMGDKEGHWEYNWYAIETGPHTGKYVAYSGGHNWAEFDATYDWEEESNAKFMADVMPLVESFDRRVMQDMDDFAYYPEDWDGYTLFQLNHWYVNPGQNNAFREGLTKIHAALSEGNYEQHFGFQDFVSGGKGNEILLVLPMKGYADFADNDPSFFDLVSEAMGGPEAFQAFMAEWGATYKTGHSYLVRYLPEASDYGSDD